VSQHHLSKQNIAKANGFERFVWQLCLGFLTLSFVLPNSSIAEEIVQFESRQACVQQLFQSPTCSYRGGSTTADLLKIACRARAGAKNCETLKHNSSPQERPLFLDCENPYDLCEFAVSQRSTSLFSCGAGAGGVLIDSVLGLVLLPHSIFDEIKSIRSLAEAFDSCQNDVESKIRTLGVFRPSDMTEDSIRRMSCDDVQTFKARKVEILLERVESRRQRKMAISGTENVDVFDLPLTEQEAYALNFAKSRTGLMGRASCFRPEESVKVLCSQLTKGIVSTTGVLGGAKLLRTFTGDVKVFSKTKSTEVPSSKGAPKDSELSAAGSKKTDPVINNPQKSHQAAVEQRPETKSSENKPPAMEICSFLYGECWVNSKTILSSFERAGINLDKVQVLYVSRLEGYGIHVIVRYGDHIYDAIETIDGKPGKPGKAHMVPPIPIRQYFAERLVKPDSLVREIPANVYQNEYTRLDSNQYFAGRMLGQPDPGRFPLVPLTEYLTGIAP
jgi:hypothetical protein